MALDKHYYSRTWDTAKPKAVVMLIHGVAEHSGRYQAIGDYLALHDYTTMAFDLPGHGRTGGVSGHINHFSDYTQAALSFYKSIKKEHPDLPVFLLGHSMGGLISAQLLIKHQKLFKGALLSGPAIEVPDIPPPWQVTIIKLLAKLVPKLKLLKVDASGISQDSTVVKNYLSDPLVYKGKLSARFLLEISNAMENCKARVRKIKLPIYIMHGGSDTITKPSGSQFLYDRISSKDKTLKIYPGLYHEIFNETDADTIYADITDWLNSHNGTE